MSSGPFKRSKPSEDLEAIRFKYFSMPPELKALIDEQAAKDGQESPEWLNSMADRLVSTGLSQAQLSQLVATKLPSVNAPNSRKLIDYVEDIIAGKLGGGHYAHKDEKGNKNFRYTGVELQPVNPDGTPARIEMFDDDEAEKLNKQEESKLIRPPMFKDEDLKMLRQKLHVNKYIRNTNSILLAPIEKKRGDSEFNSKDVKHVERVGLESMIDSLTKNIEDSKVSEIYLSVFNFYLLVETLTVLAWVTLDLQSVLYYPTPTVKVVLISLLIYDYIFGHFKYLNWLWLAVGSYTRFILKVMLAELVAERLAEWTMSIILCMSLFSALRLAISGFKSSLSGVKQIIGVLIIATIITLTVMVPALDAVAVARTAESKKAAISLFFIKTVSILVFFALHEWEMFSAQSLLANEKVDHSKIYTAVEVSQDILSRLLVVPHQIKRCKMNYGSINSRMYPNTIVA